MTEYRKTEHVWKQYRELASGKNKITRTILWIFAVVAAGLLWTAKKLHLSYNAINILVYYWLIPVSWLIIIDWKVDAWVVISSFSCFLPLLTLLYCFMWVGIMIATGKSFGKWCDSAFEKSVDFLNYFNRWGGNYELNSVIICIGIPIIIYGLLFFIVI